MLWHAVRSVTGGFTLVCAQECDGFHKEHTGFSIQKAVTAADKISVYHGGQPQF